MALLTTPTLQLSYEEYGSATGAPLLLLHGFPDSAAAWRPVVEHLLREHADAPPRILVPSLRGYGETRLRPGHAATGQQSALAADILELLDALEIPAAVLAGHDWGARAAYAAAVLSPERVRAVVALATAYQFPSGPVPSLEQAQAHWYQYLFQLEPGREVLAKDPALFGATLWRLWSPHWNFSQEELAEAQAAWKQPEFADIVVSYYRTRFGNQQSPPEYSEAQARLDAKPPVPVPVFLAQGEDDHCELLSSTDGLERFYPAGLRRCVLQGAGHFLPRERPQEVAEWIGRALEAHA